MQPKILFIDTETSPVLGWSYDFYDTNLLDVYRDWSFFCFSWKWLGEKTVHLDSIKKPRDMWDFVKHPDNDYQIVRHLWRLLDECEIAIGHNIRRFDVRKIYSRFLYFKLPPPSPFKAVDTLAENRRISADTKNSLEFLVKHRHLGEKMENDGWPMHRRYMEGSKKDITNMHEYCKRDTDILEPLYKNLLPYISGHPNLDNIPGGTICPRCGSSDLEKRGVSSNKTTQYIRIRCKSCGGWSRSTKNIAGKRPIVSL